VSVERLGVGRGMLWLYMVGGGDTEHRRGGGGGGGARTH